MRKLTGLFRHAELVTVVCRTEELRQAFLRQAEEEGFAGRTGMKPTDMGEDDLYTLHKDMRISQDGFVGHVAMGRRKAEEILSGRLRASYLECSVPRIWVDYGRFAEGSARCVLRRGGPSLRLRRTPERGKRRRARA